MAKEYDFQIGQLTFRSAISDQFPYARSTAPFRKEQFDSSATVGDQSLTGWWTRGQFSFHKGLGIKYYEVLDGQEILDRATDSDKVHPWEPGRLRLTGNSNDGDTDNVWTTPTNQWVKDYVSHNLGEYTVQLVLGGPDLLYKDTATVVTHATAGDPRCIAKLEASPNTLLLVGVEHVIESMSIGGTSTTALWTHGTTTFDWYGLFAAKDRIWGVGQDSSGQDEWYVLDSGGGSIPVGGGVYKFWEPPEISGDAVTDWSLAESPGVVYLARGQFVWAATVDETGSVATPTVVADLGPGAEIRSIKVHRGRLAIWSEAGFCVAEILGDDGTLVVGPLYIKFGKAHICRSMTTKGDYLYFSAVHPDDVEFGGATYGAISIYEVNMVTDVAELQPAYVVRDRAIFDTGGNGAVCWVATPTESWLAYAAVTDFGAEGYRGEPVDSPGWVAAVQGYIVTGQHRLGTLEPKQFFSITVTCETDTAWPSQRVEVRRVDKDGTETYLGAAFDGQTTFDLSDTDPTESMGFKFTLFRGATLANFTPTLLGYQIKALPTPSRQRILKWPLAIQNVNKMRRGTSVGREGKAWSDLEALEALENSQSLVSFFDWRTGESGQAYIDSVEFQADTPSTATTDGFGGVAYVTLRVLD